MAQESTKYEPTPCEQRILEVLLNPENRKKTVTEICRIADVDRKTYYNAFKKSEFVELVKDESRRLVQAAILPTIHTFIKETEKGSFQHGKVLLEMADVYREKKELEVTGSIKLTELLDDESEPEIGETETETHFD